MERVDGKILLQGHCQRARIRNQLREVGWTENEWSVFNVAKER